MDLPRCATCVHWQFHHGGKQCVSPKFIEGGEPDDDGLAYSYDESGAFWTGPNFGCVNHESMTRL